MSSTKIQELKRAMRVYRVLMGAAYRAELQYRGNLLLMILGGLTFQIVGLAFIGAVVYRYGDIGGWQLPEIAFLYGLRLTAHGLWLVPFGQVGAIDVIVRQGEFDRYLVRPANPLVQLLTRRLVFTGFGDLIGGVVLLGLAAAWADLDWSPLAIGYLILAVIGGALIELSAQLACAAGAFRMLTTHGPRAVVDQLFNTLGHYPMHIFGAGVRFGLTFALPIAFVSYVPATVLLGRQGELSIPYWLAIAAPLVGVVLFAGAYRLWARQIRHYTSSGH
ncbi:MAG: ABC transporter permease [Actinophytocola sp.]|uniref:ABC transporter permease n=1 Tax=Actinophytocola sp. TaxID=1872138 RepID=UPI003D6BAFFE